jgi:hypothetical protein
MPATGDSCSLPAGMGAVYFFFDWLSKSFGLGGLNRYRQMIF